MSAHTANASNQLKGSIMGTSARTYLVDLWLDYVNNYLTISVFAEHNGLTIEQAGSLLALANSVYISKHPEA